MKALNTYGTAVLGLLLIGLLVGFTEQKHAVRMVDGLTVILHPAAGGNFVTAEEMLQELEVETDSFRGNYLHDINTALLEEKLEAHPMVRSAEVYFEMNGEVYLEVWQRQPILRFFDGSKSFYWDSEGAEMPLSKHFTAYVPLYYGTPSNPEELFDLVLALRADTFCRDHISGISEVDGDYILTAHKGKHEIVLGSASDFSDKIERLKLFYDKTIPQVGWDKYSKVNLKYAGQVVCTTK